jgi:hypothetical protein
MDANKRTMLVGAACAFGGFVLGGLIFGGPSGPAADPTAAAATAAADAAALDVPVIEPATETPVAEPAAAPLPASDWRIDEQADPLTDRTIKTACATSSNQVYLSPPYGPRGARLCIRQHPKFGRDAYLTLDGSGQILCRSYDGCTIQIRFDDGPVQTFSANGPSDNSSETIFVANEGRFITSAKAASRIRVQLEFYQNGNQTFDFPARGLEW